MNLRELQGERRSRAAAKLLPYVGYIIQSGVAFVLMFILIAFSAWYTSLLKDVPSGVPIRWIMLAVLLPAAVHSSFRTYLQPADAVFLLPQEHRMKEYFSAAWIRGTVWKGLRLLLVLILLWPLYIRTADSPKSLFVTAALLLGVKLLSAYGCWREMKMLSPAASAGYRLLRWAALGLIIAAWLWQPFHKGLGFSMLLAAAYLAALAVPGRHAVPWERLIALEKVQSGRAQMLLGWFVEVPGRQQRVYSRRWLSRWGAGLPWRRDSAYRYLLTKSFARGDVFGIVLRIGLLALLLEWWNRGSLVGAGIYLFFLFITGVQLSALSKLHGESFWLTVYPLPENSRTRSTVSFVFRVHLAFALSLWLPLAAGGSGELPRALGVLAAGVALTLIIRLRLERKMRRAEDDDL
ncbi:ABC transporter permease [Paenibacillus durus]|uniref:ABC transporter permease n=2 Tax=Paenibacillus durus TaxID=44251 RepID=A0A0F7FBG7_PAEDU|nr:ABC transporter permease [Paenibacillus durus]AKG36045.1 ABC transporter permease [Paenibacillus durus ATCC 35681]